MAYNLVNYANCRLRMNSNQDSALSEVEAAFKLSLSDAYIRCLSSMSIVIET
jgi:hypothetical protein